MPNSKETRAKRLVDLEPGVNDLWRGAMRIKYGVLFIFDSSIHPQCRR